MKDIQNVKLLLIPFPTKTQHKIIKTCTNIRTRFCS